jgi:uncharacterized protein (DUF924 family)
MERVDEILRFWFGDGSDPEHERRWFVQDAGFDLACRNGFLADHESAARGELDSWKNEPSSVLALILLLDQFPRNIFRGTPRAFATDSKALATAKDAITREFDLTLLPVRRSFIYLPFQHSENLEDQYESVRLFRKLADEHPEMAGHVKYADDHFEVIRRFGRFPHRNAVLGRISTPEESEFLRQLDHDSKAHL